MAFIVSADEIKKELTNYSPGRAEEFHRESAMKADKIFSKALKEPSYIGVILLNGGTASGKIPIIYSVIPDDLKRAFIAFLSRDRKFSDTHFYKTHSGSRRTLLWIAKNYPSIEINIVESSYTLDGKLQFSQIQFDQKKKLTDYLVSKQMTANDIIAYVSSIK